MNGYERMIAEQREEIARLHVEIERLRAAIHRAVNWFSRGLGPPHTPMEIYLLAVLGEELPAPTDDPDPTGTE
jgi:hypothetical protein